MMIPLEKYQEDLLHKDFYADPAQEKAVQQVQKLFDTLLAVGVSKDNFSTKIKRRLNNKKDVIKGVYLWGGVGSGKTYVMDLFYQCLPFKEKKRIHFYCFMQMVHQQLKNIHHVADPLQTVADDIAAQTIVLCFDEFQVSDIVDAMLLGRLFRALFEHGIVVLVSSNDQPSELYKDGLQREQFLPTIDLIGQYMNVINVDSSIDYRLRFLAHADVYYSPLDSRATAMLKEGFNRITSGEITTGIGLEIIGRTISTVQYTDSAVWFDFDVICNAPRGPSDYIEIARSFQTVAISAIPIMDDLANDQAKRFVNLIDELYDRNVKLLLTAASKPDGLYTGKHMARPFQRTISRLQEMRTHAYLSKQHNIY